MVKKFRIDQSIAIEGTNFYYDLHNNYEFSFLDLSTTDNHTHLHFLRKRDEWVPMDSPENIVIQFLQISHISFSESFFLQPCAEIEELGYKNAEDFDMDWLANENSSNDEFHFIIRFANDEFVRLFCERVEVMTF